MNKITKKALVLCLVGSLALEQPVYVEGASIIDTSKQITTVETVPHVLTTGTTSDLERKKIYNINVSEQEKEEVFIPIVATNAGLISCDIQCKSNVVTAGSVTAAICTDKKGTIVKGTEKKMKLSNKGNDQYESSFGVKKGKKYYLQLKISQNAMTETGDFKFQLELQETSSSNRTLKNKQVVKAYQNGKGSVIYYKVVVKKSGYLTVDALYEEENCGNPSIVLCNSKKKAISLKVQNHALIHNKTVFAVKKGTYYLKVADAKGSYQINATFSSVTDKSGTSKTKAKKLKVGGAKVKGVVLVTDKKSKYDWYKFTLNKSSYVRINFTGSTTGNSKLMLKVIPEASNVKFTSKAVLQFDGIDSSGSGQAETSWPAGTWYICVNKSATKGSGVYSLKVKTFH